MMSMPSFLGRQCQLFVFISVNFPSLFSLVILSTDPLSSSGGSSSYVVDKWNNAPASKFCRPGGLLYIQAQAVVGAIRLVFRLGLSGLISTGACRFPFRYKSKVF